MFMLGAFIGLIPALLIGPAISLFAPHEHMLQGLAGIVVASVTVPLFWILFALRLKKSKQS